MNSITTTIIDKIELKDYKASWQKRVFYPENLLEITLEQIFFEIKTSKDLEEIINQLRAIPEENAQQAFKKENLPYFNLGQFDNDYRKDVNLLRTSFFIFDYDHLDKIEEMKSNLQVEEAVFAYFVSPRGNGLKVIYRLDKPLTNHEEYSKLYKYYAKIFNVDLGERPDKTSDASRACFFSYDPDLYINTSAVPLTTVVVIEEAEAKRVEKEERTKKRYFFLGVDNLHSRWRHHNRIPRGPDESSKECKQPKGGNRSPAICLKANTLTPENGWDLLKQPLYARCQIPR